MHITWLEIRILNVLYYLSWFIVRSKLLQSGLKISTKVQVDLSFHLNCISFFLIYFYYIQYISFFFIISLILYI